ncbi:hypothetical protein Trihar35433_4263 [Trichoderma harzianum]|nr:hypothetical protein Trihar35433_4263 [Trichoderma harzianum]
MSVKRQIIGAASDLIDWYPVPAASGSPADWRCPRRQITPSRAMMSAYQRLPEPATAHMQAAQALIGARYWVHVHAREQPAAPPKHAQGLKGPVVQWSSPILSSAAHHTMTGIRQSAVSEPPSPVQLSVPSPVFTWRAMETEGEPGEKGTST